MVLYNKPVPLKSPTLTPEQVKQETSQNLPSGISLHIPQKSAMGPQTPGQPIPMAQPKQEVPVVSQPQDRKPIIEGMTIEKEEQLKQMINHSYANFDDQYKINKFKELANQYVQQQQASGQLRGGVRGSVATLPEQTGAMGFLNKLNPVGRLFERIDDATRTGIPEVEIGKKREKKVQAKVEGLQQSSIDHYTKLFNEKSAMGKVRRFLYGNVENFITESQKTLGDVALGDFETVPEMVANTPGSTAKVFTAISRAVTNPLDTVVGITKLIGTKEGRQALKYRYGSEEGFYDALTKDPVGVASDFLTIVQFGAGGTAKLARLSGQKTLAQKAGGVARTAEAAADLGVTTGFGKVPSLVGGLKMGADALKQLPVVGKPLSKAANIAIAPTRPLQTLSEATEVTPGKVGFIDRALSSWTGLDAETVNTMRSYRRLMRAVDNGTLNKEMIKDELQNAINQAGGQKKEVGGLYQEVYKDPTRFSATDIIDDINNSLTEQGVIIKGNKIVGFDTTKMTGLNDSGKNALKSKYNDVIATLKRKTDISVEELHNIRKDVYGAAYTDGFKTKKAPGVMKVSDVLNERLKQVPGFKEVDAGYKEAADLMQELRSAIETKQGDFRGTLKSLLGERGAKRLDILEKHFPGLKDQIKAIAAYDDYLYTREHKKVGLYEKGGFLAAAGAGYLGRGPIGGVVAAFVSPIVRDFITDPVWFKRYILATAGKDIADKMSVGATLSSAEQKLLRQHIETLVNEPNTIPDFKEKYKALPYEGPTQIPPGELPKTLPTEPAPQTPISRNIRETGQENVRQPGTTKPTEPTQEPIQPKEQAPVEKQPTANEKFYNELETKPITDVSKFRKGMQTPDGEIIQVGFNGPRAFFRVKGDKPYSYRYSGEAKALPKPKVDEKANLETMVDQGQRRSLYTKQALEDLGVASLDDLDAPQIQELAQLIRARNFDDKWYARWEKLKADVTKEIKSPEKIELKDTEPVQLNKVSSVTQNKQEGLFADVDKPKTKHLPKPKQEKVQLEERKPVESSRIQKLQDQFEKETGIKTITKSKVIESTPLAGKFTGKSKSVSDNTQSVTIERGVVKVVNKSGKKTKDKYEFPLSDWEALYKGPGMNPESNFAKYIGQIFEEKYGKDREMSPLMSRIRDAQISAVKEAYKKYVDVYNKEMIGIRKQPKGLTNQVDGVQSNKGLSSTKTDETAKNKEKQGLKRTTSPDGEVGGDKTSLKKEVVKNEGGGKTDSRDGSERRVTDVTLKSRGNKSKLADEATNILESKGYSTNIKDYTPEELKTLQAFSGRGGAGGAGTLDQFFTPAKIINKMYDLIEDQGFSIKGKKGLEPAAGNGRMIELGQDRGATMKGYEIDKVPGTIAKLFTQADIEIKSFEDLFVNNRKPVTYDGPKYDFVISNPPYKPRTSQQRVYGEMPGLSQYVDYFIYRGLDLTKPGGYMATIVPSAFLKNSLPKKEINGIGRLVDAYRLPEGAFGDTKIGTDILIFKKEVTLGGEQVLYNDNFFKQNPDKILGEVSTKKDQRGKDVEYVKGDLDLSKIKTKTPLKTETTSNQTKAPLDTPKKPVGLFDAETKHSLNQKEPVKSKETPKLEKKQEEKRYMGTKKPLGVETEDLVLGTKSLGDIDTKILEYQEKTDVFGYVQGVDVASDPKRLNYYKGGSMTDYHYYQGDIYHKLDQLEIDKPNMSESLYNKQKKGLEAILPKERSVSDVEFSPLNKKLLEIPTGEMKEVRIRQQGKSSIEEQPVTIKDAFRKYLNDYLPRSAQAGVQEIMGYISGRKFSADAKGRKNDIITEAQYQFNKFMTQHLGKDAQNAVIKEYNRKYNSYVKPDNAKTPLVIKNVSKSFKGRPFKLRDAQVEGVNHLVNKGTGLIAYDVGVGKTITGLAAVITSMQRGNSKRPLFVVPKPTVEDTWIGTINGLFPTYNVVNLGGLTKPDIKRLTKERGPDPKGRIKDGEIAIITTDGLGNNITFKPETETELLTNLQDVLETKADTDSKKQKEAERIEGEMAGGLKTRGEDIYVEDLGIDLMLFDEAHKAKNSFTKAQIDREANPGVVDQYGSISKGVSSIIGKKAYMLSQYIMKRNDNRNVFLLTATPFENRAIEVYNMLALVAKGRLEELGLKNVNDFYSYFAKFESEFVVKSNRDIKEEMVMKEFSNLPELQKLLTEFVDFKSAEDANVPRPEKTVKTPHLKMSAMQANHLDKIQTLINDKSNKGNMMKGITDDMLNTLSPYLSEFYTGGIPTGKELLENSPKIKYTHELIRKVQKTQRNKTPGVFVFMPYFKNEKPGTPDFDLHNIWKKEMMDDLGLKESEIGIIKGGMTQEKKDKIAKDFREGKVKVLLGGSNTAEGIDLQTNGLITVNLSLDWNPTQPHQVGGRVHRQGNPFERVFEIYPLVENSGDIFKYQKYDEKGGRINNLFNYQGDVFKVEEVDFSEKKLALTTDPKQKAENYIVMETKKLRQKAYKLESEFEYVEKISSELESNKRDLDSFESMYEKTKKEYEEATEDWKKKYKKENMDDYKKRITGIKQKIKNRQQKLKDAGIDDVKAKLEEINRDLEGIRNDIKGVEGQTAELEKKFTQEFMEREQSRKSIEELTQEVFDEAEQVGGFDIEAFNEKIGLKKQDKRIGLSNK